MNIKVPSKYELYLQSPEFDEIRQKVFSRDGHKCVVCGSSSDLRPHHLTYRNIYREDPRDLITLCSRCHAIYHSVEKRAKYIDDYYAKEDEKEINELAITARNQREKNLKDLQAQAWKEIIEEGEEKDYSKNGNLDMTNWDVIDAVMKEKEKELGLSWLGFNKTKVQQYFIWKRYLLLKRCIEKSISQDAVIAGTKLSPNFVRKYYGNVALLDAKIEQGHLLYKED